MSREADESEVMRSFISCLMKTTSQFEPWQELTKQQQLAICSTYFILDINPEHPQYTVDYFVQQTLKRIFAQLMHKTRQYKVESQGSIRGCIHWPLTLKSRYSEVRESPVYICRRVQHYFDTPENQLLKYLIDCIVRSIQLIPTCIRTGFCHLPSAQSSSWQTITTRLTAIESLINLYQQNIQLRNITLPKLIDSSYIVKTENTDSEAYLQVTKLYQRYQSVVISGQRESIKDIGRRILVLPNQVNKDTQTWINIAAYCLKM